MRTRISLGAFVALLVAGCTTASGPTYNVDTVTLTSGEKAYRVQCQGIFESRKVCVNIATKICKEQPVRYLQTISPGNGQPGIQESTREIMFTCGAIEVPPPERPVRPLAVPVPAPVLAPTPVHATVHKITLRGDANFSTNSAVLNPVAKRTLDRFLADSREANTAVVTISGHTDSNGSALLNGKLSLARAESVAKYLRSHGLRVGRYEIHGYGSSRPIASNRTVDGRGMNRRVEIEVADE